MRTSATSVLFFIVFLFAGLAACESGTEREEPGSLSGLVIAEDEAVKDVEVSVSGPTSESTTTDGTGAYEFAALPPGTYEVEISNWPDEVQYTDPDRDVTVAAGTEATADFAGAYVRTASIDGTVRIDGEPFEDVTVLLAGPDDGETTTDSQGRYRFSQLRAGEYTVSVEDLPSDVEMDESPQTVEVGVGDVVVTDFSGVRPAPVVVEVPHVERPGSSLRFNLDAVEGEADVVVKVDPGSETVTAVRLFLGSEQVATESFEPGELSEPTKLELRVNTAEFDAETGEPRFPNGTWAVEAVADTEEGGSDVASDVLEIGIANQDRIAGVQAVSVGEGTVSQGRRWFGARDLHFEVVPVIYEPDRTLGAITVRATGDPAANGGSSLDLGSGSDQDHRVEGPESFTFTASLEDNDGRVEDDPDGDGHTIRVVRVFDEEGTDITSEFVGRTEGLDGFYVDFVPPQVGTGSQIQVGGMSPGGEWLSEGDFSVTVLSESGAGGTEIEFEVDDSERSDPIVGAEGVDDLPEGDEDRFAVSVASISDAVGNMTDAGDLPGTTASFGVDRTPVEISEVFPEASVVLNTDDAAGDGVDDNRLVFTAQDPDLEDETAGSGYDKTTVRAIDPDGSVFSTGGVSPDAAGENTISLSGLPERSWTVEATTTDLATPANEAVFTYSVVVDRTGPDVTLTDTPPNSTTVSGGSVTFSIDGTVVDENGVSDVIVTVRDADDGTADVCEPSDALLAEGSDPGEVDENEVDVTGQVTASEDGEFTASIQFQNAGAEQDVCFYVESADVATDRNGNPEPNTSAPFVRTVIDWN